MFPIWLSGLYYVLIFFTCVLILNRSEKGLDKNKSTCLRRISVYKLKQRYIAYTIIWLIAVLRYDIGADYENTVFDILDIVKSINYGNSVFDYITESMKEPGLFVLSFMFSWLPTPYIWVIASYFTIFIVFLYKVLEQYNIHRWGIVVLFLSIIIFQSWDWIRQSTAMIIMLNAISYCTKQKNKTSIIFVLISAFFHYSSLLVIPFLLIFKRIRLNKIIMIVFLLITFFLSCLGFFKSIYEQILSLVPFYGELYMASQKFANFDEQSYSNVPYLLNSIWFIFLISFSEEKHKPWTELLFIGSIFFMVSGGSLLLDRSVWYFTCTQLILAPMLYRDNKSKIFKFLFILFIGSHFILLSRRFFIKGELRGCVPYQTILSSEAQKLKFRYKED